MATSNKVFVSPGVYTSERDLSFVAQSVGVTTLGIVGETLTGPAFEPIFITNYDEFTAYFGGTLPQKFVNTQIPKYEAAYIAKAYLQQSNQLFVTRVLGLSGYDAGPSWSITTQANLNPTTLSASTTPVDWSVSFTGTSGDSSSIVITTAFPAPLSTYVNDTITLYNGSTTTMEDQIKEMIYDIIQDNSLSATTQGIWGVIADATYNTFIGNGFTNVNQYLDTDGNTESTAVYTADTMDV